MGEQIHKFTRISKNLIRVHWCQFVETSFVPFVVSVVMMPDMPAGTEPSADVVTVQRALLANLGVRVDEHTAQYLLKRKSQRRMPCAIYACDGRTGAPLRIEVSPDALATDN